MISIVPMAAAINLLSTTNQRNVNTLIAGQAALMSQRAAIRCNSEANNVVDMETTESSPKPVDGKSYYKTF